MKKMGERVRKGRVKRVSESTETEMEKKKERVSYMCRKFE